MAFTAGAYARAFLDLHPSGFNAALRGHVALAAGLVEVAVLPQEIEKAVLSDVVAGGLLNKLCHLAHQDRCLCHFNGFGKDDLGAVGFGTVLKCLALCALFLEGGKNFDCGLRVVEHCLNSLRGGIHAVTADGRDDFVGDPPLESFCFFTPRANNG